MIEPEHLLCNGSDERGGLFARKVGESTFEWAAIHPERGVVEPYAARNLVADRSRLDPTWPPSKPRPPEDEALVPDKARVAVAPAPPRHPFRLYGHGVGPAALLVYRVHFAEEDAVDAAMEHLATCDPFGGEVERTLERLGAFVLFGYDDDSLADLAPEFEHELVQHFERVHARFPILEVVNVAPGECDSAWQTWSVEEQSTPDEGPKFGFERGWPYA